MSLTLHGTPPQTTALVREGPLFDHVRYAIRVGLPGAWALKHTIGSYLQLILKYLWQLVLTLRCKVVEGGLLEAKHA